MGLATYRKKRDFEKTPEPKGSKPSPDGDMFVVQKHDATRLHYDFRLELDGVLKSWAVPKGPSLDPEHRRLAVETEDHPVEYGSFEGNIPEGEYGAGPVQLWDHGRWIPRGNPREGYRKGVLKFLLEGDKLHGGFALVRLKSRDDPDSRNWLLLKERDAESRPGSDLTVERPESVVSGRRIDQIGIRRRKTSRTQSSSRQEPAAALPESPRPMLATLADKPPEGPGWSFEIKHDGYRALCLIGGGATRFISRNGLDWTDRFGSLIEPLRAIRARSAVLDGEVVALLPDGRSSFQALQQAISEGGKLMYFVFDLLHLDGKSLAARPLRERRKMLAEVLADLPSDGLVRLGEGMEGDGKAILEQACSLGLEGLIAKRLDSTYSDGARSRDWLKLKCKKRQELVIAGWTDPTGSREGLGALLVGYHDEKGRLVFAGKVGTGFTRKSGNALRARLDRLGVKTPALHDAPRMKTVHWVQPELVAEVEFTEWTNDGKLRHPSFQGLREDKEASSIVRESPSSSSQAAPQPAPRKQGRAGEERPEVVGGVRITHPSRVIYEDVDVTKADLARYYEAVSPYLLPHLKDRLLSVVRCPQGAHKKCFYQRHPDVPLGDEVHEVHVTEEEGKVSYLCIDSVRGLLSLAQMGAIELHGWGSRRDEVEQPDRITIDLDPDESLAWARVVEGAFEVRAVLEGCGLESFVKTTGGKGIHVVAPLQRKHGWDEVRDFSAALASKLANLRPDRYTAVMSKRRRVGKIYVDYLRNLRAATAVAAWSARARAGATVSAPLTWEQLAAGTKPGAHTVRTVVARLQREGDPWEGFFDVRQRITSKAWALLK